MKKMIAFVSVLLAELIIVAVLLVLPSTPVFKAVKWEIADYKITAVNVKGVNDTKINALNEELTKQMEKYDSGDETILRHNSYKILSNTSNISVIEITTSLTRNATPENPVYEAIGSAVTQVWIYVDSGDIQTQYIEISNTIEI